MWEDEACK